MKYFKVVLLTLMSTSVGLVACSKKDNSSKIKHDQRVRSNNGDQQPSDLGNKEDKAHRTTLQKIPVSTHHPLPPVFMETGALDTDNLDSKGKARRWSDYASDSVMAYLKDLLKKEAHGDQNKFNEYKKFSSSIRDLNVNADLTKKGASTVEVNMIIQNKPHDGNHRNVFVNMRGTFVYRLNTVKNQGRGYLYADIYETTAAEDRPPFVGRVICIDGKLEKGPSCQLAMVRILQLKQQVQLDEYKKTGDVKDSLRAYAIHRFGQAHISIPDYQLDKLTLKNVYTNHGNQHYLNFMTYYKNTKDENLKRRQGISIYVLKSHTAATTHLRTYSIAYGCSYFEYIDTSREYGMTEQRDIFRIHGPIHNVNDEQPFDYPLANGSSLDMGPEDLTFTGSSPKYAYFTNKEFRHSKGYGVSHIKLDKIAFNSKKKDIYPEISVNVFFKGGPIIRSNHSLKSAYLKIKLEKITTRDDFELFKPYVKTTSEQKNTSRK